LAGYSYRPTKATLTTKMKKTMTENTLKKSTISYCRRNNIDEKQLLKAMNWYLSAKQNNKENLDINHFAKL
jgi:hypothetical protein